MITAKHIQFLFWSHSSCVSERKKEEEKISFHFIAQSCGKLIYIQMLIGIIEMCYEMVLKRRNISLLGSKGDEMKGKQVCVCVSYWMNKK